MRLFIPLAVAAGPLVTIAAIAVPLPLPPVRDSFPPAHVPTIAETDHPSLRRTEDTDAPYTLPGRRIGRLGGYYREDRAAAPLVSNVTKGVVRVVVISTTTSTEFETVTTTGTITPTATPSAGSSSPSTTSAPSGSSSSRSCDLRYCDAGTSYCEYWGGYSSFDVSQGRPVPGETRTSIGVCSTRATPGPIDSTTSASASSSSSYDDYNSSSTTALGSSNDPLDSITCTSTIKTSA